MECDITLKPVALWDGISCLCACTNYLFSVQQKISLHMIRILKYAVKIPILIIMIKFGD